MDWAKQRLSGIRVGRTPYWRLGLWQRDRSTLHIYQVTALADPQTCYQVLTVSIITVVYNEPRIAQAIVVGTGANVPDIEYIITRAVPQRWYAGHRGQYGQRISQFILVACPGFSMMRCTYRVQRAITGEVIGNLNATIWTALRCGQSYRRYVRAHDADARVR
jgi:hypothetical protein